MAESKNGRYADKFGGLVGDGCGIMRWLWSVETVCLGERSVVESAGGDGNGGDGNGGDGNGGDDGKRECAVEEKGLDVGSSVDSTNIVGRIISSAIVEIVVSSAVVVRAGDEDTISSDLDIQT